MNKLYRKLIAQLLVILLLCSNSFAMPLIPEEVEDALKYMDLEKYTSTLNSFQQICNISDNNLNILDKKNYEIICNSMMATSYCSDIEEEKRVSCNDFDQNEIDVTSWYFIKKCAGGLWESIKDLIKFLKEAIVWAVENFDGETRKERIDTANEFYNSITNYLAIEYEKAMEVLDGEDYQEIKAANAVFGNILTQAFKTIGSIIQKEYIKLGCYEPKERVQRLCKAIGDVTMPPTFAIGLIIKGPSLLRNSKKIAWLNKEASPSKDKLKHSKNIEVTLNKAKDSIGRPVSKIEEKAILKAHFEVGVKSDGTRSLGKDGVNPAMAGNYTAAQLSQKAKILRKAGLGKSEVRKLMEDGVVGLPPPSKARAIPRGMDPREPGINESTKAFRLSFQRGLISGESRYVSYIDPQTGDRIPVLLSEKDLNQTGGYPSLKGHTINPDGSLREVIIDNAKEFASIRISSTTKDLFPEGTFSLDFERPANASIKIMQKGDQIVLTSKSGNRYPGQYHGENDEFLYLKEASGKVVLMQKHRLALVSNKSNPNPQLNLSTVEKKVDSLPLLNQVGDGQHVMLHWKNGDSVWGHYKGEDSGHIFLSDGEKVFKFPKENISKTEVADTFNGKDFSPTTNPGKLERLVPEEVNYVMSKIPHDQRVLLNRHGLGPQDLFLAPSGEKILLSKQVDMEGRPAYIMYIMDGDKIYPRTVYKSQSQGVFRITDGITTINGNIWYSKGVGEEFLSVPPKLLKILLVDKPDAPRSISSRDMLEINNAGDDYLGLLKYHGRENEIPREILNVTDGLNSAKYKRVEWNDVQGGHSYQKSTIDPRDIVIRDRQKAPDFSRIIDQFDVQTAAAGNVKAYTYSSKDGSITYTVYRDKDNKVWFGDIYSEGKLNRFGISSNQINMTGLSSPRWEYHSQIPNQFRATTGNAIPSYGSNWNYIREIPEIQLWYQANNIPLPPREL